MVYRFASDVYEAEPVIYLNVFNNSWGTNFPQWMGGQYRFRIRLCPYTGEMSDEKAYEIANRTLSDFAIGNVAETHSDVELLAFKMSEDRKGVILRLKSTCNRKQTITINPKFSYIACYYADITEEPLHPLNEGIVFESEPHEIHTLYFER